MNNPMLPEHSEIIGLEPVIVADLNAVIPTFRQLGEEAVEISHEVPSMLVVGGVKAAEFKNQQTDVVAEGFTRPQKRINKQLGVQEVVVRLPCLDAKTREIGEPLQRDVVGHFEGEQEIARHLLDQAGEVSLRRKLVVSGIHADGFEDLRVFGEAIPLEPGLGKLPPVVVALFVVDLPTPARILPTRRAD